MNTRWSYVRFAGIALWVGLAYAYIWYWLYQRWSAEGSFFSHGYLIPIIFLWLVHRRKERLSRIAPSPDLRGLLLIVPALILHLCATYIEVYSPSGLTLPVLLAGIILYFRGWETLKVLIFPVVYLFFAIPMPMNWVHLASFHLKIAAIGISTSLAGFLGAEMVERGSYIVFRDGGYLLVASPCSGLRSLIALTALGVLYAVEFTDLRLPGRAILIVLSVPIAMIANVLRITFLCLVAHHWGADAASGLIHDLSGYAIYAVALLLLVACARFMGRAGRGAGRRGDE